LEDWLHHVITPEFPNAAILIDEASSLPKSVRAPFFAQLRAVASSAGRAESQGGQLAARLVFAFAGTFRPTRMIDDANSPFNVAHEINPDDLTCDETLELATLGLDDDAAHYANRAFTETGGQPYYAQHLFLSVQSAGPDPALRSAAFDRALEELQAGAHGHLEDLTRLVDDDNDLRVIVPKILGRELKAQAGNPVHGFAVVAGVARRERGYLVPRNPIYASALARFAEEVFP
jgi:hypothetical protein